MLVAGKAAGAAGLEDRSETVQTQGGYVCADGRMGGMEGAYGACSLGEVGTSGLEVLLPAIPGDRHLEDLGRSLVDRGDADVAPDLLHDVGAGVAVAPVGLQRRIGGRHTRLAREVLRDGTLRVEQATGAFPRVESGAGLLDNCPSRFQSHHVRDDELVRVALLLAQRGATLDPLGGV